jgi:hypothetical protein
MGRGRGGLGGGRGRRGGGEGGDFFGEERLELCCSVGEAGAGVAG